MTITAAWTAGTSKKAEEAGAKPHHAHSSASPPGTEHMPAEPDEEPAKPGGLKITRHVDFDLMSDK